jgi:hypothetical protein
VLQPSGKAAGGGGSERAAELRGLLRALVDSGLLPKDEPG